MQKRISSKQQKTISSKQHTQISLQHKFGKYYVIFLTVAVMFCIAALVLRLDIDLDSTLPHEQLSFMDISMEHSAADSQTASISTTINPAGNYILNNIYLLGGIAALRASIFAMGIASLLLLYLFIYRVFGQKDSAFLGTLFFSFTLPHIIISKYIFTDIISFTLFMLFLFVAAEYYNKRRFGLLILMSVLPAAFVLTDYHTLIPAIILTAFAAYKNRPAGITVTLVSAVLIISASQIFGLDILGVFISNPTASYSDVISAILKSSGLSIMLFAATVQFRFRLGIRNEYIMAAAAMAFIVMATTVFLYSELITDRIMVYGTILLMPFIGRMLRQFFFLDRHFLISAAVVLSANLIFGFYLSEKYEARYYQQVETSLSTNENEHREYPQVNRRFMNNPVFFHRYNRQSKSL